MKLSRVLPLKLRRLIKQFSKDHNRLEEAYYADGECWDVSRKFVSFASGIDKTTRFGVVAAGSYKVYKKHCAGVGPTAHWIAVAGNLLIDFTARQFHPNFAYPRIWTDKKLVERLIPHPNFQDTKVLISKYSRYTKDHLV